MRNTLPFNRSIWFYSVILLGLLFATAPVNAAWYCAQGTIAEVQTPGATDSLVYYGWGPEFDLKPSRTTWVHIAIPGPANASKGAQNITINVYTGSVDAWFSDVHVYNGRHRIYTTTGSWSNGHKTISVDLGSVKKFDKGLSISLLVKAGVEMMSHEVQINGACANFVNIP